MSMFHARISTSVAVRPRPWLPDFSCAIARGADAMPARPRTTIDVRNPFLREFAHRQITTSPDCSDVNIVHRPVARAFPPFGRLITIVGMQAANCDQLLS